MSGFGMLKIQVTDHMRGIKRNNAKTNLWGPASMKPHPERYGDVFLQSIKCYSKIGVVKKERPGTFR